MPCFLILLAFFAPRLVILLLAIFSNFMSSAYYSFWVPLLGFVFMPFTTLAYALAINWNYAVSHRYLVVVIFAVLMDLGVIGGGMKKRRGFKL